MENVVKIQHFNRFANLIYFGYLLLFYAVVREMGIHPIEGGGGEKWNGPMPEVSRGWDQAHLCSNGLISIIISNCNSYIWCTSIIHLLLMVSFFPRRISLRWARRRQGEGWSEEPPVKIFLVYSPKRCIFQAFM